MGQHFPGAKGAEPFLNSVQKALAQHGIRTKECIGAHPLALSLVPDFAGITLLCTCLGYCPLNDRCHSAALTNLCRDESTDKLKAGIDSRFGDAFNINGLGGVITAGATGIKAGLSHAPVVRCWLEAVHSAARACRSL